MLHPARYDAHFVVHVGICMGVRREVLRGVHQIQLGVWGAL